MSSPIGIAFIGAGLYVKDELLPAVLSCPWLSLKAIYSRTLRSAQEAAQLIPAHGTSVDLYSSDSGVDKDYYDLLRRTDVRCVVIALPIGNQPEYVEAALAAGKNIWSEKPLAPNMETAQKLLDLYRTQAAKQGITWTIGEQWRFMPKFARAAVEVEKLGGVTGFEVKGGFMMGTDHPWNGYFQKDWRKFPAYRGAYILDGAVHWVAALRQLLGKDAVDSVIAYTQSARKDIPPPDSLYAVMRTKSGAVGSYINSVGTYVAGFYFMLSCVRGSVTVTHNKLIIFEASEGETEELDFSTTLSFEGVKEAVQAWAAMLETKTPNPLQVPEQALADLEIVEAMLRSGNENGSQQKLKFQ